MRFQTLEIPGVYQIFLDRRDDNRGSFVKMFHKPTFESQGLSFEAAEQYYSVSKDGVLRGLHFQLPPHDHDKRVCCISGEVFDVIVDLRVNSPTYTKHVTFRLSGQSPSAIHIPRGCAHGFQVTAGPATLCYAASTIHAPDFDAGILWNSAGVIWPILDPLVSDRDQSLPTMDAFVPPFRYSPDSPKATDLK